LIESLPIRAWLFLVTVAIGLVLAIQVACRSDQAAFIPLGFKITPTCPQGQDGRQYFPIGYLTADESRDASLSQAFARFLRGADLPPLWCGTEPNEEYRMLWLPSYRPVRIASLSKTKTGWVASGVEFVDPRNRPAAPQMPTEVKQKHRVAADQAAVNALLDAVEKARFWMIPSWRLTPDVDDGQIWVMEGRREGTYRVVTRVNTSDPSLEDAIRMLMRLAGMVVPEEMR
jgi:hypothetical protein